MMVKVFPELVDTEKANSRLNSNAKSSSVAIFISELFDELSPDTLENVALIFLLVLLTRPSS